MIFNFPYKQILLAVAICLGNEISKAQPLQQPRPNIVLIIADDVQYGSFDQTGAPAFFDAPNIQRISDEGATFDNFYCVYSLCIPARASIFTGLYPHLNHAYDNVSNINPQSTTISTVLDSIGYHCAEVGKYHFAVMPQKGFEYWLATAGAITYTDPLFNYNGTFKEITGNITDIITDSSSRLLSKIDTPFFVSIEHLAPHREVTPQALYDGIYDNDTIPPPPNFYEFTKWYPSFLYDNTTKMYTDTDKLENDLQKYYEGLKGVDDNVDSVFAILAERGILDNTLVIFTADNGATYGEHELKGKTLPYEPSMQLPLFIRYPKWFGDGIHFSKTQFFGLGVDLMPTILDAAHINPSQFQLQGLSLRKLAAGTALRDKFYFEKIKKDTIGGAANSEDEITPTSRTVRTLHYKYTDYQCDHDVEEYFDLDADPLETQNLIHDPAYQARIAAARITLDSMKIVLLDTIQQTIDTVHRPCHLIKANRTIIISYDTIAMRISPNPATDLVTAAILSRNGETISLSVYNAVGMELLSRQIPGSGGLLESTVDVSHYLPGIYFVKVQQGKLTNIQALLIQ